MIKVSGVVSESDIVGALFGQTEGLLEESLELKQLQKSGRIGRISFKMNSKNGVSSGKITIPSSLNKINTAILAATLETVERVGPCSCEISLDKIVDVRQYKRDQIAKRAAEIMKEWNIEHKSISMDIAKYVEKDTQKGKIIPFGPDKLNAGPDIFKNPKIIVVEGRADVVVLVNMGLENVIALDGTKVPHTIKNLAKNREVTVLLDGDRGGDMILKELLLSTNIDYIARAPFRKEVEDLSYKEIRKSLKNAQPYMDAKFVTEKSTVAEFLEQEGVTKKSSRSNRRYERRSERSESKSSRYEKRDRRKDSRKDDRRDSKRSDRRDSKRDSRRDSRRDDRRDSRRRDSKRDDRRSRYRVEVPREVLALIPDLRQTQNALFLGHEFETLSKVKTANAFEELEKIENCETIVIDGVITQRMLTAASKKSIKLVVGAVIGDLSEKPKLPEIAKFNRN